MDDKQRARIHDDLKGFFRGDLRFDDLSRSQYSTDASLFQIQPAGIAAPLDEEDLQGLVRYAYQEQLPLIARGAGTGLAGESLGRGLIVDLSRHFREIVSVGDDHVRVQPGVVLQRLQARLRKDGRRFAPDPASGAVCTIGGMLANNASGSNAALHGYTRDHVREIRFLLDNGDAVNAGIVPLPLPFASGSLHFNEILESVTVLLERNDQLIRSSQPKTAFNRCGYALADVYSAARLQIAKALVGSEGTLALFTEAVLETIAAAGGEAGVVLCFASLEEGLRAGKELANTRPITCDVLGRRLFSLARGKEGPSAASLIPPLAEAVLLLEFEGASAEEAEAHLARALGQLQAAQIVPLATLLSSENQATLNIGEFREAVLPSLYGVKRGAQPVSFIEDVAVPLEHLSECVVRIQGILKEHETTGTYLIHAATGQIHARPFLDLSDPNHVSRLSTISDRVHSLVLSLGGAVSSQHGTGLARTAWVARQYGALYPVLRQLKAIFDPRGIFNPGKIVNPDQDSLPWPLRKIAVEAEAPTWRLNWQPGEVAAEANHCNGCGHCRTEVDNGRICPVFRAGPVESAAPRAKVNAVRDLLADKDIVNPLSSGEMREAADRCVHCKMCVLECPARVNIDKLMLEVKAANVAQHGLERSEWFFARLEKVVRLGSFFSLLSNIALRSGSIRWLLEKIFGLSSKRRLPRLARRSFLSIARRRGWTARHPARRPTVVYFPDLYANYVDPDIGEAAGLVLEHNGFAVYVPEALRSSGIEALVAGDVTAAREMARTNVRILADLAREGLPIVCTEPSSAIMLGQDYLDLIDELDSQLVAKQTVELTQFLGGLAAQGRLLQDFQPLPLSVGHHVPCHVKSLNVGVHGPNLLRAIPELEVRTLDLGCSGMAGTFGLKAKNLTTSLAAGRGMLDEFENGPASVGSSECSSCRLQMENGAGKRALHPVQYLAYAYGLMPRLKDRLTQPVKGKLSR